MMVVKCTHLVNRVFTVGTLTLEVTRKLQFYTLYPVIDLFINQKSLSGAIFTLEPMNW